MDYYVNYLTESSGVSEFILPSIAALENGQYGKFLKLKQQNQDYLLYPYLEYYDLRQRLSTADKLEVVSFIDKYKDTLLSDRIKTKWLYELGKQSHWREFLKYYNGQAAVTLKCFHLRAKLILDSSKKANNKALEEAKSFSVQS